MSFTDDFLKELKKKNISITEQGPVGGNSYTKSYLDGLNDLEEERKKRQELMSAVSSPMTGLFDDDIAPVKKKEDDSKLDFFQKGAFEDGFDWSDIPKAILGTAADVGMNVGKGVLGLAEGVTDLAQYGVAGVSDLLGADRAADKIRGGAKKNLVEDLTRGASEWVDQYSVLGRTTDSIAQGLGQVGGIMLTGGLAAGAGLSATAATTGTMFASGMGSGMGEAYKDNATDGEAVAYGAMAGAADAITELIFGGMGKAINAVGFSKGLSSADDMLAKKVSSKISNQLAKNLVEFGVKASGEGFEEVLAGTIQAAAKSITYMSEKDFTDILEDENLLEQFIVGAATSGVVQSGLIPGTQEGSLKESIKENKDFITGQTVNEQAVIKKEIEKRIAEQEKDGRKLTAREKSAIEAQVEADLPKGYISTDTIEEVLGGDDFKAYKDTIDSEEALKKQEKDLTDEYNLLNKKKLGDMTGEETDRRDSLKTQIAELQAKIKDTETNSKRDLLKAELSKKVYELSKSDRLVESYLEPVRAKQKFTADLNKYEGKAKEVIKQVMDSGLADNSNATHDFWDMVAKHANERDISFKLANNQQIMEMVKAEYEADGVEFDESKFKGQTIDGFASKNGIVLNAESKRALNFVVGHEITHTLEKSKHYEGLRDAIKEYAAKEFDTRFAKRMEQYKGKYNEATLKTEVEMEVIADLVGDFLFTDQNFVNHLSTKDRNVFKKIYDEIKYLLKQATAGSKEARELERVKHLFEKAYRDAGKNTDAEVTVGENGDAEVKFSISETTDGRFAAVVDDDILSNIDTTSWDDTKKEQAKKAAANALKQFKDGIVVDGVTRKVNKRSRDEYTRSRETEKLYRKRPDVFADKMRAADVADDIVVVATDWSRDGGLDHPRKDRFVDFDHGKTLIVSGNAKYSAEVIVGIMDNGEAVFYDVVDMKPASFDIKKEEPPTAATTQNAPGAIQGDSFESKVPQNGNDVKTKLSLSDSEGRQLSKEQQDYFKDSKVRDEEGRLKAVYHGTPAGGFTKFKLPEFMSTLMSAQGAGYYFTDKRNASQYTKAVNKSVQNGAQSQLYEVYLNITNPMEIEPNKRTINKEQFKDILRQGNREWFRTDWMPFYADGNKADNQKLDFETLLDKYADKVFAPKNIGDGDILADVTRAFRGGEDTILNAMKSVLGYDGVRYADNYGDIWVAWSSNQIKNIDNAKPTADPDIRFSLSDSVEETKDLMALHNLQASELLKSLGLGGLPMPSIAVIKAEAGHDKYGDVSLIIPKNVIDPKANKYNKVYGGDAWTPTYPSIEYKVNEKAQKAIEKKVDGLVPYDVQSGLGRVSLDYDNMSRDINRYDGDMYTAYRYNRAMKYAFLVDSGYSEQLPMTEKVLDGSGRFKNDFIVEVVEKLGASEVEKLVNERIYDNEALISELRNMANENARAKYAGDSKLFKALQTKPLYTEQNFGFAQADSIIRAAHRYVVDGFEQTVDYKKATEVIDSAVDEAAYQEWINDLFSGIVEKEGIRNNADYFTPSGNRRKWEALHWENTLENVVKVMRGQEETGVGSLSPYNSFSSLAQKKYGSIEEIKADSNRLSQIPEEEYEAMGNAFADRFAEIASSIKDPSERNRFIAMDEAAELIVDAVRTQKTSAGMLREMQKYNKRVTAQTVADIQALISDIANMPTGYFEAKPQRAVSFDEVGVFVIPRNADVKLKQELLNKGYSIAEYDPDVEGDRSRVVNGFEEYKFSLSNVGEEHPVYGSYHYYSNYKAPVQEDIAPVQDSVQDSVQTPVQYILPDDYAPAVEETADMQSERLGSLTEADMPAEVETEYLEMADTQPLTQKVVKDIVRSARGMLGLSNNQVAELYSIVLDYNGREFPSREALFQEIAERFGQYSETSIDEELKQVKAELRAARVSVDDAIKNDITDYGKMQRSNFGKIRFSKEGLPVDVVYMEFAEKYPGYFPEDIINPSDQLQRMIEVANYEHTTEQSYELDDDTLLAVTDSIINAVNEFRTSKRAAIAQRTAKESFNALMPVADEYAPPMDGDIGPVAKPKADTTERTEKKVGPRQALHQNIMDRIKTVFAEHGFDLYTVLKNAKNLSTFSTVDNTPQRVNEKTFGYKAGQLLNDLTVDQVARNETEGIKWLNQYTDRKNGLLKKISDRYNIKPGTDKSAAAQMYAEGFYVAENGDIIEYGDAELAKDFPNAQDQADIKGLAKEPLIRQIYDETLALINDSRTKNAYPEIQKLNNYFLHFRAMGDTFSKWGLPFNPNDIRAKDLPTDLNGVTADMKPGQPYFASAMHRKGQRTSFDLLGGLEMYLTSAMPQIYHIGDIQTHRALRNFIADTFGQANGLEGLDNMTEEEAQERIEQVYGSHLSTYAKFLNEEANVLAGKTALIDRGLEGIIGRRGMTFLDTVNRQVGANMVGYNVSSSLTNFLAPVQAFAKTNKADFVKAFSQTVYNKLASINGNGDGFAEQSPVMIRRKGADRFHRTFWQKLSDPGYALMGAVDSFSTELIARAKYNEFTRKGMDAAQAHIEADKWTSRLMGDRSLGQQPHLYNSKMLGIVTKFQLEVRNQLDSQFYDTIQEAKVSNEDIQNAQERNAKTAAKVASTFFQLAVGQHLFGKVFESIAGYNPAFDIIEALAKAFGWDDDEEDEDTVLDNIGQGFMSLMEDMPYSSVLTGGRIPIQSALPISEFFKGKDQYGNEKSRLETLSEAAPYYLLPGGYGQIKKTVAGMNMFSDEHPVAGSYTDSGNLRFPVEDTLLNRAQAAVFGQYASSNARDYFDNERQSLKKNQIQEFVDVDIPIRDYWEYRDGLKKQETLEDKFDYIAGLDLPISKKNILINNVVDRKEPVDLSDYDAYSGYEEFDFATKNPEKYAFFEEVGISYSAYKNGDDDTKDAYDWAYNNPDKYLLSKAAASDVVEYRRYAKDLYDIKADKDASGKTISGSRKEKVIQYINNLDIDYGERLILFKSEYEADDTYNADIVEYLNGRDDISFEEEVTILKELGFIVLPDGTVQW